MARKLRTDTGAASKYSLICVHAWSKFLDQGTSEDEISENIVGYETIPWDRPDMIHSAGAAELCTRRLGEEFQVVNAEELIWRLRMERDPVRTRAAIEELRQERSKHR